jgi:hypothetical protein
MRENETFGRKLPFSQFVFSAKEQRPVVELTIYRKVRTKKIESKIKRDIIPLVSMMAVVLK